MPEKKKGKQAIRLGSLGALVVMVVVVLPGCGLHGGKAEDAAAGTSLATFTSNPARSVMYSKKDYSGTWPFSVDWGLLACDKTRADAVTFTAAGGVTYAVNGTAAGWASRMAWQPLERIWLTRDGQQSDTPGVLRVSIDPVVRDGLQLCKS